MTENKLDNSGVIRDEKGRFLKGLSGNLEGRPKGSISITTELKKRLLEIYKDTGKTGLVNEIDNILIHAIEKKDKEMLKTIWAYIDGMPKQSLEIEGEIKTALVKFVNSDETKELKDGE